MASDSQGCLFGWLGRLLGGSGTSAGGRGDALPKVNINDRFVSEAERSFFHVLRRVVGDRGHVLAQVPLRQLVYFPGNNDSNPGRNSWRNRVAQKTVDFVVCDPDTLRPLVAIELNDASHSRPDRQTRDDVVHAVLDAAGLPLIPWQGTRSHNTRDLEATLHQHLPPAPTRP